MHHHLSSVDDTFGIQDRTNRRSNPKNRNARHKRFVSSLISLAFDGFKAYMACTIEIRNFKKECKFL